MKSDGPYMLALAAENFSLVLTYAHSRPGIIELWESASGSWGSLEKLFFRIPEARADRALLEMAYLLRSVDDLESVSDGVSGTFGTLKYRNGDEADLSLRDVANKVIHAAHYDWIVEDPKKPRIRCLGEADSKWEQAEIDLNALIFAFGQLHVP